MNNKKISFILCSNDLEQMEESVLYLNSLTIPVGFEADVHCVDNTGNRAAQYNKVKEQTDAKYKIYLREDVRIIYKEFLEKIIALFTENPQVGMCGISGKRNAYMRSNKPAYEAGSKFGEYYEDCIDKRTHYKYPSKAKSYDKVLLLDDMVIATQYDLPWREDLFPEGDFCEYAQAIEFWKAGYEVAVPNMEECWCFADNVEKNKPVNAVWKSVFEKEYADFYNNWEEYYAEYYNKPCKLEGETPLVTVLTSVYNGEAFIEDTIRSIMTQTYQNLQIIVVDDCSKDRSREIIDRLAEEDSRIIKVYMTKNSHVCKASNEGYKYATGKYVAIIGHDDIWYSEKIEKQVEFMEANANYAATFTLTDVMDDYGNICNEKCPELYWLFDQHNRTQEEWMDLMYAGNNVFCAPSAMVRRACLNNRPLYQYGLVQLQDYALWFDLVKEYPVYVIREHLMKYRWFMETRANLSSGASNIAQRQTNERNYIFKNILYRMTDEQFMKFFQKQFRCAASATREELLCERAFVLLNRRSYYAIGIFMELFENEETRTLLEEKYQFCLKDFYEANRQSFY